MQIKERVYFAVPEFNHNLFTPIGNRIMSGDAAHGAWVTSPTHLPRQLPRLQHHSESARRCKEPAVSQGLLMSLCPSTDIRIGSCIINCLPLLFCYITVHRLCNEISMYINIIYELDFMIVLVAFPIFVLRNKESGPASDMLGDCCSGLREQPAVEAEHPVKAQ